jgi:hypothetical protein
MSNRDGLTVKNLPSLVRFRFRAWLASRSAPAFFSVGKISRYKKKISVFRRWERVYAAELDYLRNYCASLEAASREAGQAPPRAGWRFSEGRCVRNDLGHFSSFIKRAKTRNKWSGLSAKQAFYLEVECLERLRESSKSGGDHPFPIVARSDAYSLEIEMTDCGLTLTDLTKRDERITVVEWEQQIENIVNLLDSAGVAHLDIHPNGQNLCVNERGKLSLIDFDIALLCGSEALSFQIDDRYNKAVNKVGSYTEFARQSLRQAVLSNRKVLELS